LGKEINKKTDISPKEIERKTRNSKGKGRGIK